MSAIHFVEFQFSDGTCAFRETEAPHSEADVVGYVADGLYGFPVTRVLACDPKVGVCADVTARIAKLVFDLANKTSAERLSQSARDLCERFGFDVEALERAEEDAADDWRRLVREQSRPDLYL